MTTKITNRGLLGILRVDLQRRPQHATDWSDPTPHAFVYPGQTIEAPVGPFSRAVVSLRAIERGVDPTPCAVGIDSDAQVHVTIEHAEVKDHFVRKSVEHNRTQAAPHLTLQDRAVVEAARS